MLKTSADPTNLPPPEDPYWDTFDDWCDLYLRLSQDRHGNELGVDRQENEGRAHAAKLGLLVRRVYREDNNKSATRDDVIRDDFEASLVDAAARRKRVGVGRYTTILSWHSDRYARRVKDLLRVQESGILIQGVESGYFDLSNPAGVATAITVTAWSEYEGKQKSLRQKAAHRQRAADGRHFWTQRPFGLQFDGTLQKDEAEALRKVYDMILSGLPLNACVRYLNDEAKLPTVKGNPWQPGPLRNVLLHTRNCGILSYLDVEIGPGKWEPIIDEATYRSTVRLLTNPSRLRAPAAIRSGQGGRQSIMPGFATCSVCDDTVTTYNSLGYRLYRCRAGHVSARADFVDERAAALIFERFRRGDVVGRVSGAEEVEVDVLRIDLERLRRKSDEYETMLDNDDMTLAQFTRLNRANNDKIKVAEKALARAGNVGDAVQALLDVDDLDTHWEKVLDVHDRHTIVSQFFDAIVIHPRGHGSGRFSEGAVDFYADGELLATTR